MTETVEFDSPKPTRSNEVDLKVLRHELGTDMDPEDLDRELTERGMTVAEAAVELALAGAPYTEIARICGYGSPIVARTAVIRVIAASHDDTDDYRSMRQTESTRLMKLLRSVWDVATDPEDSRHIAYNKQAAAIIAQHSRLHGLDAPQALQFITPGSDVFEEIVAKTANALTAGVPEEADIFEAEVVDE